MPCKWDMSRVELFRTKFAKTATIRDCRNCHKIRSSCWTLVISSNMLKERGIFMLTIVANWNLLKGSTRTTNFTKIAKIMRIAKSRNFRKIFCGVKNRKNRSCVQSRTYVYKLWRFYFVIFLFLAPATLLQLEMKMIEDFSENWTVTTWFWMKGIC